MNSVMRHTHVSAMNNLVQQHVCAKAAMPWDEQSESEICLKIFTILSFEDVNESEEESE